MDLLTAVGGDGYALAVSLATPDQRAQAVRLAAAALGRDFFADWLSGTARPSDYYPYLDNAIAKVAGDVFREPPVARFKPADNTGAIALIVFGAPLFVGNAIYVFTPGAAVGVGNAIAGLVGLVLLVLGIAAFSSRAKEKARYETAVQTAFAERAAQWEYFTGSLRDTLHTNLHQYIGKLLGVPTRLHADFERDSRAHEKLLRTQWADRIAWWQRQPLFPPAPGAVPERLGHYEYEEYCAAWLRSRGYLEAVVTPPSRDGGVDVECDDVDVQCKHYDTRYVRVQDVREIFGVASHHGKRAAVITSASFSKDAIAFASEAGVALVILDERTGQDRRADSSGFSLRRETLSH